MHKAYRFCFFEDGTRHAVAVLVLHFASDLVATEEASALLCASALSRVEVWQGTRRLWRHSHAALYRAQLAGYAVAV
jgi:hypothetical protein